MPSRHGARNVREALRPEITAGLHSERQWQQKMRPQGTLTRLAARYKVRPEEPITAQAFKKFPVFYGTSKFITMFTMEPHLSASSAKKVQSTPL